MQALFAILAAIVDVRDAYMHSSAETGIFVRTMELLCGMRASGLGQNLVSVIELPTDYNTLVVREISPFPVDDAA